jgi:hypothetical protein
MRTVIVGLLGMLFLGFCSVAHAAILPSTTDLWEVNQDTVVTGYSGLSSIPAINDMRELFGYLGEWGEIHFGDNLLAGSVHWVEWKTFQPITLRSFVLIAARDGPPRDARARGFSKFTLYAKNSSSVMEELFTFSPSNPYANTPAPENGVIENITTNNELRLGEIAVAANVTPTTSQFFRAEFIQWSNDYNGHASGPRIRELDGFDTFYPIPEPSTLTILTTGVLSLIYVWRRRRAA